MATSPISRYFRGDSAAASLKLHHRAVERRPARAFPRRFRRGLIEADLTIIGARPSVGFPRRFRRGLIEAMLLDAATCGSTIISAAIPPRPH